MRKSAWVLLFCLLFSFPQVSFASAYTITEEELTQLEQNISELQTINNRLQKESSQQKKRMEELEQQLTEAQTELQKAREQSNRLGSQLKDLERTSIRQEESLRIANESLAAIFGIGRNSICQFGKIRYLKVLLFIGSKEPCQGAVFIGKGKPCERNLFHVKSRVCFGSRISNLHLIKGRILCNHLLLPSSIIGVFRHSLLIKGRQGRLGIDRSCNKKSKSHRKICCFFHETIPFFRFITIKVAI